MNYKLNKITNKKNNFIFDFDGVIADSNQVKLEAFLECIDEKNNKRDFLNFHLNNLNLSSEKKFEYFFCNLLKKENYRDIAATKNMNYNKNLNLKLTKINLNFNAFFYIKKLIRLNKKLFIVSAASKNYIIEILKRNHLEKSFIKILSKPNSKKANLLKLFNSFNKSESVYFGDTYSDYRVCKSINIDFVLVKKYTIDKKAKNLSSNLNIISINNF